MSKQVSQNVERSNVEPKSGHGTVLSYVVGFGLSLIFTVIPYWLVAGKVLTGGLLLTVILGFGFLQMAVQIFFFLHLGRGPKPLYNAGFFVATFGAILVVVVGSVFIMSHLHANMAPSDVTTKLAQDEAIGQVGGVQTGACQGNLVNHQVVIKDGVVSPLHTEAHRCDTLTFMNEDDVTRYMAFGKHPAHEVYGGQVEITVYKGHPETITLNELGTHQFHDHLHEETAGEFVVAP
jgi:cytochrome o ubiquinol oxidase operon protein cyoD